MDLRLSERSETWKRVRVALAALAYEHYADPIMTDEEFDQLARSIDLSKETDNNRPDLDKWFRENFSPSTGNWVWNHPEINKLTYILEHYFNKGE